MYLIKELGLEKCKQIVDGAPENSQVVIPCLDGIMYFAKRDDGKWFRFSDGYQKWLEYFGECDPMDLAIKLADLRTEIDHHYYGQSEQKELEQYAVLSQEKIEGGAVLVGNFTSIQEQLKSELNNCSKKDSSEISITDHCTDIRNHISPLTGVIER